MNRSSLRAVAAAVVLATGLGLSGCSGGEGADSSGGTAESYDAPAAAENGAAERESVEEGAADSAGGSANRRSTTALLERSVIATGEVALRSPDVADTRADVQNLVRRHNGIIDSDSTHTDDEGVPVRADLVLRVPTERFDTAVGELEGLAELVRSAVHTEDVTTKVIDTETRVRAQRRSLQRLEQLLAEADDLNQIIRIEDELARRQADLASLEQQQKWLADQTTMSTITVTLRRTDTAPEPEDDEGPGFLGGLSAGWTTLVTFGSGLLAVVGFLLPWLPVIAIVVLPAWLLTRRLLRSPAAAAPAEQS